MLSSILEVPVSSQTQPPESSLSSCAAEFYSGVPSRLLTESKSDGRQHAKLELSNLRIVAGSSRSTAHVRTRAAEKCSPELEVHSHEEMPAHCRSAVWSPATEETQIKDMDDRTSNGCLVMEAQDSTESDYFGSLTKQATERLLHKTIEREAHETERETTGAEILGRAVFEKMAQKVLESKAPGEVAWEALAWEAREVLEREAREVLRWEPLEAEACEAEACKCEALERAAREALVQVAREALVREAREALEREAREALEREAREALVREAREALEREAREAENWAQEACEAEDWVEAACVAEDWVEEACVVEVCKVEVCEMEARVALEQAELEQAALERAARAVLAREVLEREAREALEREAREALEREAREALEREAREALEREAREALEREAREEEAWEEEACEAEGCEALEWEACAALVFNAHRTLEPEALVREALEREALARETREALEQEMLSRETWEALALEREAREALKRAACEVEAREVLEREALEREASAQEALEREAREALEWEAREVLKWEAQDVVEQDSHEAAKQDSRNALEPEAQEQETWDAQLEAHGAVKEQAIKQQSSTPGETLHENKTLPMIVLKETECLSGSKRTDITDVLDSKGEGQQDVQVMCKIVPKPYDKAPAGVEPLRMRTASSEMTSERISEHLPADSSECPDEDQSLASCQISENGTFAPTEPSTPVNDGPSRDPTHTAAECASATVCLVPDVYSTTSQEDDESHSSLVDQVRSLAIDHCTPDPENGLKLTYGSVPSSCVDVRFLAERGNLKDFHCRLAAAVPPSLVKYVEHCIGDNSACKVEQRPAVQETSAEEQLLHERMEACRLCSEDGDPQIAVSIAGSGCSHARTVGVSSSSPVRQRSKRSVSSDAHILHTSVSATFAKESFKRQAERTVAGEIQKVVSSEILTCDPNPVKSILCEYEVICSSSAKERVHQGVVSDCLCTQSADCSSDDSARRQLGNDRESLCCCMTYEKDTSSRAADQGTASPCKACVVSAAEGVSSDLGKPYEFPPSRAKMSPGIVESCGSQCSTESILMPVSSVICELKSRQANCLCHKRDVCDSSMVLKHLEDWQRDSCKDSEQSKIPTLKYEVMEMTNIERNAMDTIGHSAQHLNNLSSLNIESHTTSYSDSLDSNLLVNQTSERTLYDSREVSHVELRIGYLEKTNVPKCIASMHHISTPNAEDMNCPDTQALQSTSEDPACIACSPRGSSTALYISTMQNTEVEANGVTLQGQYARTTTECSKENALNSSKNSTSSHINSCVLHLDKPGAMETEDTFSKSTLCGHEGLVAEMDSRASRANPTPHPAYIPSEAGVPEQEGLETPRESTSDLNSSMFSQPNHSMTDLGSSLFISRSQIELPSAVEASCLKTVDSADLECSKSEVCLIQALVSKSSLSHMLTSNEGLEPDVRLANDRESDTSIVYIEHGRLLSASESDRPDLSGKLTVVEEELSQENLIDCATTILEINNQQGHKLSHLTEVAEPKGSVSDLPEEQQQFEGLETAYHSPSSSSYHSPSSSSYHSALSSPYHSASIYEADKAINVEALEGDIEHPVRTTRSDNASSLGNVDVLKSRKEVRILLKSSTKSLPQVAPAAALSADGQLRSTHTEECKMTCEQFSTEQTSLDRIPEYELSDVKLPDACPIIEADVEPTSQPTTASDSQTGPIQVYSTVTPTSFKIESELMSTVSRKEEGCSSSKDSINMETSEPEAVTNTRQCGSQVPRDGPSNGVSMISLEGNEHSEAKEGSGKISELTLLYLSDSEECSISLLKNLKLQDICQGTTSKLEVCKILSPPSAKGLSMECSLSIEDAREDSGKAAVISSDSIETKCLQCRGSLSEAVCRLTPDFHLERLTPFMDNGASADIAVYKPCLVGSHTQKICTLQVKYPLETECHLPPQEECAQAGHVVVAVSQKEGGRGLFKRKRVSRGTSKHAEATTVCEKETKPKPGTGAGLEVECLMQTVCCGAEAAAASMRSLKINSLCEQGSVCRSQEKDPTFCQQVASMINLQEMKRPKSSLDLSGSQSSYLEAPSLSGNAERCLLSCPKIPPMNTPSVPAPNAGSNSNTSVTCDDLLSAFELDCKPITTSVLKKQPDRKCKMVPSQQKLRNVRKLNSRKSLASLKLSPEPSPPQENTLLHFANTAAQVLVSEAGAMRLTGLVPKQRGANCRFMKHSTLRKSTKEAALLDKLSIMASRLLLPAQSSHKIKPSCFSCSKNVMLPDSRTLLRSNRLLEIFSCIKMRMNSHCSSSWSPVLSKEGQEPLNNEPMALYPAGSSQMHYMNFGSDGSSTSFDTPVFPMSFHIKLDSRHLLHFARPHSQHYTPGSWEPDTHSPQPSEWTLSFFLSHSSSVPEASDVFREDFHLRGELKPRASCRRSLETTDTTHERGRSSMNRSQMGCSMHGLHTVLALSSPGCYRVWTRRRNLGSRIPTVQRLFMAQFAQGLKGIRSQASIADEPFSSLPYSLGRVLSTWSQHGVSASPSEFTDVYFNTWQPPVETEPSHGQLPCIPFPGVDTTEILDPRLSNHQETSSLALAPIPILVSSLTSSPLEHYTSQLQVHFDEEVSPDTCVRIQSSVKTKSKVEQDKPQRVSQIRIRKTIPKQDSNLTPMGLPRPKRLKKKEFSLEEIYTNKNYKSPPAARCLETIFEEPKEKNGALVAISQQKRKRVLEFQDFTVPRKRKAKGKVKVVGSLTRGRRATSEGSELDALLIQKLMDLEIFLAEEEARETICGH